VIKIGAKVISHGRSIDLMESLGNRYDLPQIPGSSGNPGINISQRVPIRVPTDKAQPLQLGVGIVDGP
jgi:hypothetical protein